MSEIDHIIICDMFYNKNGLFGEREKKGLGEEKGKTSCNPRETYAKWYN